jgi:SpoVK/Ycf46/Vps4 family AAA+-type ATPase
MISSFLGETAANMRKVFDFIDAGRFVVLFDEFDAVGKEREDPSEHGELKRVVNSFLQMVDAYRGKSVIVAERPTTRPYWTERSGGVSTRCSTSTAPHASRRESFWKPSSAVCVPTFRSTSRGSSIDSTA